MSRYRKFFVPAVIIGSSFAAVGFAGYDDEAPVIVTDEITVPYKTALDASKLKVTDNKTPRDAIDVQYDGTSVNTASVGTYFTDIVATDSAGNSSAKTIKVVVKDVKAPKLSVIRHSKKDIMVEAGTAFNPMDYVTAIDDVDGDVTPFIKADGTVDTSKTGVQYVTYEVEDVSGNKASKKVSFMVEDSTAPELTQKTDKVSYGGSTNLSDYFEGKDSFSQVTLTSDVPIDSKKEGKQTINVTAADESGNKATKSFTLDVQDMTPPVLTLATNEVKTEMGKKFNAMDYVASATDAHDGDVKGSVTVSGQPDMSRMGTYAVTYTVKDKAGNSSAASLNVIVRHPEVVKSENWKGPRLNKSNGTVTGPTGKETYYNLPMNGVVNIMRRAGNNDRYWVRDDGVKMLGDYIMVAADQSIHPLGSLVATSLGCGIVTDTGTFIKDNPYQLDIAVAW